MKRLHLFLFLLISFVSFGMANDGVYLMSGNCLVPIQETDISVKREILTITIGQDSLATVDVYYELLNKGKSKTVTMAFEAEAPYNAAARLRRDGVHPCIKSFTVNMNDQPLPYRNAIVARPFSVPAGAATDFTPLDLSQWKGMGEVPDSLIACDNTLYNAALDSTVGFAYGYFFTAPFKAGLNRVHHTYSFLMSYTVMDKFRIDYWLTPITRWANHQADEFTLFIKTEDGRDFCLADTVFAGAPFKVVNGWGDVHRMTVASGEHYAYVNLGPGAALQWHTTNFCPKAQMAITSADYLLNGFGNNTLVAIAPDGNEYRYIGDCGNTYFIVAQDYGEIPKAGSKVVECKPERGEGYIFPAHPGRFNVRRGPSLKSPVITTIGFDEGDMTDYYPCLGYVQNKLDGRWWYRIKVGGKTGYVSAINMTWDAFNAF